MASDELFPLWRLTGMPGMRRDEVCGLLWADVDLDAAQLRVRRQLGVISRKLVFAERPKSDQWPAARSTWTPRPFGSSVGTGRPRTRRRLLIGEGWQSDLVFCGAGRGAA